MEFDKIYKETLIMYELLFLKLCGVQLGLELSTKYYIILELESTFGITINVAFHGKILQEKKHSTFKKSKTKIEIQCPQPSNIQRLKTQPIKPLPF